jgi:hypothetical protein
MAFGLIGDRIRRAPFSAAFVCGSALVAATVLALWLLGPSDPRPAHSYLLMFWKPFARTTIGWNPWVVAAYTMFALANVLAIVIALRVQFSGHGSEGAARFATALSSAAAGYSLLLFLQPSLNQVVSGSPDGLAFDHWSLTVRVASLTAIGASMFLFTRIFFAFPEQRPLRDFETFGTVPPRNRIEAASLNMRARTLRWFATVSPLWGSLTVGLAVLAPHLAWDVHSSLSSRPIGGVMEFSWIQAARLVFCLAFISVAFTFVIALLTQYRYGGPTARNTIRWLYLSVLFAAIAFAIPTLLRFIAWYFDLSGIQPVMEQLAAVLAFPAACLCFVTGIGTMVLGGGAFDAGLYLSRTIVMAAMGLILTITFVAIESILQEILVEQLGLSGRIGTIITALAVTFAVGPIKRSLDARVDRLVGNDR